MPVIVQLAILKAAEEGDVEEIRRLHDSNNSIEITGGRSQDTPLIAAAKYNQLAVVGELINRKANLERKDKQGQTALIAAATRGHREIVKALLDAGSIIDARDTQNHTALSLACSKGHLSTVRELLGHGVDVNDRIGPEQATVLLTAAFAGELDVVKFLVENGARVSDVMDNGNSALLAALSKDRRNIAEYLIEQGADISQKRNDGKSCVLLAAIYNNLQLLEYLLSKGQSILDVDNNGRNALHHCSARGQKEKANFLINHGVDINLQDLEGNTALHIATSSNSSELVRYLLSFEHCKTDIRNKKGETAEFIANSKNFSLVQKEFSERNKLFELYRACECGDFTVIKQISSKEINDLLPNGQTVLSMVSKHGHMNVAEKLLETGASVNLCSPLKIAAGNGHLPLVQLYLREKADINAMDAEGSTPLHEAVKNNHYRVVWLLVQNGATLKESNSGVSPLEQAVRNGNENIVRFLRTSFPQSSDGKFPTPTATSNPGGAASSVVMDNLLMECRVERAQHTAEDIKRLQHTDVAYEVKSEMRGRAVIINNQFFERQSGLQDRAGSQWDMLNLERLFKNLNFHTVVHRDLRGNVIVDVLRQERGEMGHIGADAFVLCILSHGTRDFVFGVDGKKVNIENEICSPFDGKNWPILHGKPKLFVIQACQGETWTRGEIVSDSPNCSQQIPSRVVTDARKGLDQKLHEKADMLVAFSTAPGYVSYRDTVLGSWFIRAVVQVFSECAHKEHVLDMLTKVCRKVTNEQSHDSGLMVTHTVTRLTKQFYFFPGYHL